MVKDEQSDAYNKFEKSSRKVWIFKNSRENCEILAWINKMENETNFILHRVKKSLTWNCDTLIKRLHWC